MSTPKTLGKLAWNHLTVFWLYFGKIRRFFFYDPSPTYKAPFCWLSLWKTQFSFNKDLQHFVKVPLNILLHKFLRWGPIRHKLLNFDTWWCFHYNAHGQALSRLKLQFYVVCLKFQTKVCCSRGYFRAVNRSQGKSRSWNFREIKSQTIFR